MISPDDNDQGEGCNFRISKLYKWPTRLIRFLFALTKLAAKQMEIRVSNWRLAVCRFESSH